MKRNVEELKARLYGIGIDSTTRLKAALDGLKNEPSSVFWPVFIDAWDGCDDTWWERRRLLTTLRRRRAEEPEPWRYLEGNARRFFDSLPKQITVFRGCSRPRVRGVAWTTDPNVADKFTRPQRGISVPDPVIARAVVPRAAVFFVCVEREEAELVLDPVRLEDITTSAPPPRVNA